MYGGMATKRKARKRLKRGHDDRNTGSTESDAKQTMQKPKMPMMAGGGKLNMVKNKAGKMVSDFAADGVGKMMYGGMAKKKKGQM